MLHGIGQGILALETLVLLIGATYFAVLLLLGATAGDDRRAVEQRPDEGPDFEAFFLVPALNEELVLADSIASLLAQGERAHVIVIDDASADRTAAIAEAFGPDRVRVCRRVLPEARLGKGRALNAGYLVLLDWVAEKGLDPAEVVVGVMDADGQLSEDCLDMVLPLFADRRVGGVQLPVKIRNRGTFLTNVQDFEFWGATAVAQVGRRRTGSVSLGGNGQFTRLVALVQLGTDPWSDALTEDLDLAISLSARGWRLTSTKAAWVSQQGVESIRALVRQRTRWYQGHMTCAARVGELWNNPRLSNATVLETTMYLLSPFLLALPWSILFHYELVRLLLDQQAMGTAGLGEWTGRTVRVAVWYLVGFAPAWGTGWIYYARVRHTSLPRAVLYGHLASALTYVTWLAAWRALFRIVMGRREWRKTARHAEPPSPAGVAVAVGELQP